MLGVGCFAGLYSACFHFARAEVRTENVVWKPAFSLNSLWEALGFSTYTLGYLLPVCSFSVANHAIFCDIFVTQSDSFYRSIYHKD